MQEVDWLAEMFLGGAAKSIRKPVRRGRPAMQRGLPRRGSVVESSTVDGIHPRRRIARSPVRSRGSSRTCSDSATVRRADAHE
jgi:hypothetical protein